MSAVHRVNAGKARTWCGLVLMKPVPDDGIPRRGRLVVTDGLVEVTFSDGSVTCKNCKRHAARCSRFAHAVDGGKA